MPHKSTEEGGGFWMVLWAFVFLVLILYYLAVAITVGLTLIGQISMSTVDPTTVFVLVIVSFGVNFIMLLIFGFSRYRNKDRYLDVLWSCFAGMVVWEIFEFSLVAVWYTHHNTGTAPFLDLASTIQTYRFITWELVLVIVFITMLHNFFELGPNNWRIMTIFWITHKHLMDAFDKLYHSNKSVLKVPPIGKKTYEEKRVTNKVTVSKGKKTRGKGNIDEKIYGERD